MAEIKNKFLGEVGTSKLVQNIKDNFSPIDHTHTAEEIGADKAGSAVAALTLAKQHTDEQIATITAGNIVVKESEHSSTADTATNATNAENAKEAEHAVNADNANHATNADHATTADSSTKAEQDGNGNVITDTYETKADASAKLSEAKSYTDTAVANLVNSAPETLDTLGELATAFEENADVVEALNEAITNKADKSEIPTSIVRYVEQELTEEQKMQARKNLDLPYKYEDYISLFDEPVEIWAREETLLPYNSVESKIFIRLKQLDIAVEFELEYKSRYDYGSDITTSWYGNYSLIDSSYNDTGEPIVIYKKSNKWYAFIDHRLIEDSTPHTTFSMEILDSSEIDTKYVQLPEEYIPDTIARKSDIPEIPEHTWESLPDKPFYEEVDEYILLDADHDFTTGSITLTGRMSIVGTGNQVIIEIDDDVYTATVYYEGNPVYDYYLYDDSEKCPVECVFGDVSDRTGLLGNVHIRIYKADITLKTIDEKFLPDTIARVSDIPEIPEHTWESLPDKPFYSNKTTLLEINEPTITFKEGSSGLREVNLSVDTTVLPDDKEFSYVLKINDEKVQTGTVVYMGYFDISPSFSNSSYMIGGFGRNTEINIKIWNPDLAEDTEVSLALEFYDGDLKQIDEEFIPNTIARLSDIPEIPTDTLVYTEQSLEESEKMQARSNLGLYYSHEVPNKSLVFDYVNNTINIDTLTLTEGFDVIGDYIVIALGNEYNLSSKCFEHNDLSVGRVSGIKWIGNPHLIDNSVYAEELANETENTDLEFVIYWSVDVGTGYWCNPTVVFDPSLPEWLLETEPLYIYKEEGFRTEYETIPEEFIPDTIARKSDIPEHTWESLPDKPFGKEITATYECTLDNNTEYNTVDANGKTLYYICSDLVFSGDTCIIKTDYNGNKTVTMSEYGDSGWVCFTHHVENDVELYVYSVMRAGTYDGITFPAMGTYTTRGYVNGLGSFIYDVVSISTINLQKIDEEYIPDTIARVSDIDERFEEITADDVDAIFAEIFG